MPAKKVSQRSDNNLLPDGPGIEMRLLEMCEALLPKTTERSNPALKKLLEDIRKKLEG